MLMRFGPVQPQTSFSQSIWKKSQLNDLTKGFNMTFVTKATLHGMS
jgi:hypothetical protein